MGPSIRYIAPRPVLAALALALASTAGADVAAAAEVKHFRAQSRDDFLAGTLDGVGVAPLGGLGLSARLERVAGVEEPFVFAAASHPDGWVLGTGNDGRVLLVSPDGAVRSLFQAPEAEVFAVWSDPDGTVFAGTSPDGKVYRIPARGGDADVFFDPEETYVWRLARASDGGLLVATGLPGRLYHVAGDGTATRWLDSGDAHVRALAVLGDGTVLAGTAGRGLILRRTADGTVRNLHDATHPEVLDFAVATDGSAYVALLASEASWVDLSGGPSNGKNGNGGENGEEDVTVAAAGSVTVGSRGAGFTGPRSVVARIEPGPGGRVEPIWSFEDETVHALLVADDGVWVGTGQQGGLYRWRKERMTLEHRLEERQITALVPGRGGRGPAVVTTNAAAVYHLSGGTAKVGTFTSPVLDAGQSATFGTFSWWGTPGGGSLAVSFRSGMGAEPDDTWSPWSAPLRAREVPLADLAAGRYVQWRAELRAGAGEPTPRLDRAELSYRHINRRPRVEQLEVLDPGEVIVPANFNPQNQTFEPWSPNRDGIFTSLQASEGEDGRTKTLWKKGYRTLRWTASDPNEDELRFALAFRRETDAEEAWLPMAADLEDAWYSFDATVLPDGVYRFQVTASDVRAWPEGGLSSAEVSGPIVVDHTPPRLLGVEARGDGGRDVEIEDGASPLREASLSVDGGAWSAVPAADGLLDGRREVLRLGSGDGARLMLLRVVDAAWNVVTFDVSPSRSP